MIRFTLPAATYYKNKYEFLQYSADDTVFKSRSKSSEYLIDHHCSKILYATNEYLHVRFMLYSHMLVLNIHNK